MTVLVTAAGGNVGSAVLRALSARGVAARAFDRASETIEEAMTGVDRLFLACPNVPEQLEFESRAIDAAAAAGVARVVKLSAIGAAVGSPLAFWDWHGRLEQQLRAAHPEAVVLRPATYMTSLLTSAASVAATGRLYAPAGDARVAVIDPGDVGAAGAAALMDDVAPGTYVLTGPRAISYAEIAAALGAEYVDVPAEAARASMAEAGLPPFVTDFLVLLFEEMRSGTMATPTPTVRDLTGREARDFTEFAREYATV
jgi:uncharacterized protein YbjT (DUF2867 family)